MKPKNKLDAVLPLLAKDYDRFRLLDRSLKKNLKDLNIIWVITTDCEYDSLKKLINDNNYRIIPQSAILPELSFYEMINKILHRPIIRRWSYVKNGRYNTYGWYIQQVIKLAMAERVETDFYLTLDADVICMRQVGYHDLIQNGKAITNITKEDVHPNWYKDAERVLQMPRSGLTHGVTPAIFSRDAVLELQKYLAQETHPVFKLFSTLFPKKSILYKIATSWRSFLIRNTPWTEYSLYHTFLEAAKLFDRYHIDKGPEAIYGRSSSVWSKEQSASFDLDKFIKTEAYFLIFQSTSGIPIEDVWGKIGKYIE